MERGPIPIPGGRDSCHSALASADIVPQEVETFKTACIDLATCHQEDQQKRGSGLGRNYIQDRDRQHREAGQGYQDADFSTNSWNDYRANAGLLVGTIFIIDIMKNDACAVREAEDPSDASVSSLVGRPTVSELYIGAGLSVRSSEERES